MSSNALAEKITAGQILDKVLTDVKVSLVTRTFTDDELVKFGVETAEKEALPYRVTARKALAMKKALKNPDTEALEPLEQLEHQRAMMVLMAGDMLRLQRMLEKAVAEVEPEKDIVLPTEARDLFKKLDYKLETPVTVEWLESQISDLEAQGAQANQEIQGLDQGALAVQEQNYATLEETYQVAKDNLAQAEAAIEMARDQLPTMLLAKRTHEEGLKLRDEARAGKGGSKTMIAIVDRVRKEMQGAVGQYNADHDLDADLDASKKPTMKDRLAKYDVTQTDSKIQQEIEAAASK